MAVTRGEDKPLPPSSAATPAMEGKAVIPTSASPWDLKKRDTTPAEVFDSLLVPHSLGFIEPILRLAAEIEIERPRVAFLCEYAVHNIYVFVFDCLWFVCRMVILTELIYDKFSKL